MKCVRDDNVVNLTCTKNYTLSFTELIFFNATSAGIAAGLAGTTLGHPLDTIKTRLQTQHIYHGAFHCAKEIAKNEGVRS